MVVNTLTNLHTDETSGSRLAGFRRLVHVSVILILICILEFGIMMIGLDCELQIYVGLGKGETRSTL